MDDDSKQAKIAKYRSLGRSYFVALTFPSFEGVEDKVIAACANAHLVELRVDLLSLKDGYNPSKFIDFVTRQFKILRTCTKLDIIYTVRTKAQGGAWPDNDFYGRRNLYSLGLSLGADILDVEMQLDEKQIKSILAENKSSLILASQHDWTGALSWDDGSWSQWYDKGAQYGDIVKLVGTAKSLKDNIALENFRARKSPEGSKPLIAINMGGIGQMSRILNPFMSPVTHEALGNKAAPGQLSVAEIRQALKLMGLSEQ